MDSSLYFKNYLESWQNDSKSFMKNNKSYIEETNNFNSEGPIDFGNLTSDQQVDEIEKLFNHMRYTSDVSYDNTIIFWEICDAISFVFNWRSPGYVLGFLPLGSSKEHAIEMLLDFLKDISTKEYVDLRRVIVVATFFLFEHGNIEEKDFELVEKSIEDFDELQSKFFIIKDPKYPDLFDFDEFLNRNKLN